MRRCVALVALLAFAAAAFAEPVTPEKYRRRTEQTYLTYPEWFLVHSPAEFARYVASRPPSAFPFLGHVAQMWSSYGAVIRATRPYPFNTGYHVMIVVICSSTTLEYGVRSAYETVFGGPAEVTRRRGMTEEEVYSARVAQQYVDFIRVLPWYQFDFTRALRGLWTETSLWGRDPIRKWERKYALTSEYAAKAFYGWLIERATRTAYEVEPLTTAVVIDRTPAVAGPDFHVLQHFPDGSVLATVPRYEAFKAYAQWLARSGAHFREIAGNDGPILVTLLVPSSRVRAATDPPVLFEQRMLTEPQRKRVAYVVPVTQLSEFLVAFDRSDVELEHVYDY